LKLKVHVPLALKVTAAPLKEHTLWVVEVIATGSLDVAVALGV
jgi:hypothetical protein